MENRHLSRPRLIVFATVALLGMPLLTVALVEGGASLLLLVRDLGQVSPRSEAQHTEYDPELGWIHLPDLDLPDIYGPGIGLHTNAQRFRADAPTMAAIPEGHRRIICAGDSFTLGYGVANHQTWCHLLAADDPSLETVNMGQAGYGIDQAFLWYQRDGLPLQHDMLVFAYITDDFRRAGLTSFEGYAKPILRVVEGGLEVDNVPVPRPLAMRQRAQYAEAFRRLRVSELHRRILEMTAATEAADRHEDKLSELAEAIVHALAASTRQENRTLVLVHLPTLGDYTRDHSRVWRERMADYAEDVGAHHFDLIGGLRELPLDEAVGLFAHGHFNAAGNAWAAAELATILEREVGYRVAPQAAPSDGHGPRGGRPR